MNHLPAPKKQTQNKANFFQGQNEHKIALKIYPFGIDCPIVLKELKLTDSLCHSRESGNPVKNVDSVSSTE